MHRLKSIALALVIVFITSVVTAAAQSSRDAKKQELIPGPVIDVEDVSRFYALYDAAGGHPTSIQLQQDYIDAGSEGLHVFAKLRNITGTRIAEAVAKDPKMYSDAKRCMAVLPSVRQRLES